MPDRGEPFLAQTANHGLGQVAILKATTGECYPALPGLAGHLENQFHQRVVDPRRDPSGRLTFGEIMKASLENGEPVAW